MELKVADLVSQGLSNKDVAAQCWVSPRTVAFHLRNVFTKTGSPRVASSPTSSSARCRRSVLAATSTGDVTT